MASGSSKHEDIQVCIQRAVSICSSFFCQRELVWVAPRKVPCKAATVLRIETVQQRTHISATSAFCFPWKRIGRFCHLGMTLLLSLRKMKLHVTGFFPRSLTLNLFEKTFTYGKLDISILPVRLMTGVRVRKSGNVRITGCDDDKLSFINESLE